MIPKEPKKLRRFFSSSPFRQEGDRVCLSLSEAKHMKTILRMVEGDRCLLIDGAGAEAVARLQHYTASGGAELEIEEMVSREKERSPLILNFYVAVPQRGKMDAMIEKAQEWGVDRVQPIETEWTVVKMAAAQKQKVVSRWEKIAREAAKQSGSLHLIDIREPVSFEKAVESVSKQAQTVIFHPGPGGTAFADWASSLKRQIREKLEKNSATEQRGAVALHLFIGPEGGFTDEEVLRAKAAGAAVVHLGETLLKVDTAFLGVLSALKLLFS